MWYRLPPRLGLIRDEVEEVAKESGLDFFKTYFYVLDFRQMNEVIADNGFPERYPHWRFGMEYEKIEKFTGHGVQRVYELVINSDPAIAYLLEYNSPMQQKLVMAHVYAHVDFLKNNVMFKDTDRKMIDRMRDHARIIEKHIKKVGLEKVEEFIDCCLSLDNLIDPFPVQDDRKKCGSCSGCRDDEEEADEKKEEEKEELVIDIPEHLKEFVNLENFKKNKQEKKKCPRKSKERERDALRVLIERGDMLEGWQKDILSIIRAEAYYFQPQRQTKIMNEGWATFWHERLLLNTRLADDRGLLDYSNTMAGIISKERGFNPYRIGFMLFHDIMERWDKGRHGLEYEQEEDMEKRMSWDTHEGKGLEKIFEARATLNDEEFLRTYLTDDFIRNEKFFEYELDPGDNWYKISGRNPRNIRNWIINMITNEPVIYVKDDNFMNSRKLLLEHEFTGMELDIKFRDRTLKQLFNIWRRPVYLITRVNNEGVVVSYDGQSISMKT